MPLYEYETKDGERVTEYMTVSEMEGRQRKDGTIRLRDGRMAQRCWSAPRTLPEVRTPCWPRMSEALGVSHPSQIPEATKQCADAGVDVRFDRSGRMEIRDAQHEKAVMRAVGCKEAGIINRKSYVG